MELVRVDDEKAAPVHNNKLNAAPPVHNKLNRTLSSASDETTRASAEAPAPQERPTLEDRPPSFLRRVFAGHTPHTSGRKRFVPKKPVKENRRYGHPARRGGRGHFLAAGTSHPATRASRPSHGPRRANPSSHASAAPSGPSRSSASGPHRGRRPDAPASRTAKPCRPTPASRSPLRCSRDHTPPRPKSARTPGSSTKMKII